MMTCFAVEIQAGDSSKPYQLRSSKVYVLKAFGRPTIAAALAFMLGTTMLHAQGLQSPETIETIIGSEVVEREREAVADPGRVIAAIENTAENTSKVRRTTMLQKVDIVFLSDAAATEGGPPPEIDEKVREYSDEITSLRQELEGNAMLYHAIDSRQILIRDILAVEFDDENGVVIYAAAKPPG
jgi:hypothetical protein